MMNLFDLSAGMAGTKKAFRDGSIGGRNRPVGPNKAIDPVELHSDDKSLICESRKGSSVKRSNTIPMKMLIAQEMCKDTDAKRKPPNVIARLMGLDDALPGAPSVASSKRNLLDGEDCKQRQVGYLDRSKSKELQSCCNENKDFRDVYEVRRQSSRSNFLDDGALQNGFYESRNDKRMAFVREKFIEAKRLATDEKLLESKEFHDALEVLSSNRDLFLKFLDEPNSLFLSGSEEHHFIPSPPQTKRITVLRPSKTNETKFKVKNQYDSGSELRNTIWNSGFAHHPMTEKLPEPTRIVVLKPSPRKHLDLKSPVTPFSSSPERPRKGDGHGGQKPRDPDGRNMAESLSRHRRDESLLSSVFSNGYVGDDSSFNRSENYVGEDYDNSDSEIGSYWDFMSNRYGSPYSHSPLNRASRSPESSSVVREAKKRLSERWALVTSNVLNQEKLQGRRSSGTLGEMLSINELKMENRNDNLGFRVEEFRMIRRTKEENGNEGSSGCSLSRSKSVPASSPTYGSIRLNTDDSDSRTDKSVATKSQSGKTSFKGRVTSLFFSKSKRSGRDDSFSSQLENSADTVDNINGNSSQAIQPNVPEISLSGKFEAESGQISPPVVPSDDSDTSKSSLKASLSHEEPGLSSSSENHDTLQMPEKNTDNEKNSENQNHPSPTSILDAPFKDESNENAPHSSKFAPSDNPQALSRSPPIESIARTFSWDDHCSRAPLPASLKLSRAICSKEDEDDPKDLIVVQNLLTASGLYKNKLSTIFNGWHSPDIPLDPNLLDELSDLKEGGVRNRERRSNQKLIFDCLNLVLQELGHSVEQGAYQSTAIVAEDEGLLAAQVWPVVKSKLSGEGKRSAGEAENGGLVVERLLGRELTCSGGWTELMQSELAAISREIGEEVLEELVGEVLVGMMMTLS
ncbi:uncharacterized protein LOC110027123 [Phalaenopsis equestris]|uniref:uncharacterized protein LOC110027123 n=1 Tax=Phalaenopsis equestris TaxID=78828 RepID=UPI0009E5198B|nr:uncharacterized protein LOC110027123 [Phalaenopsis equestris]XP_020584080.1 uncharacterized protein LOC110027123 [Phalaenopsis equestris]XP_020584081.1 uncharacterized protein LOC110027123 [Phalaenopsis equestris]XP_020584082.1 uncharacterized protein LOC110027123 [Phalaenopsis equestris]